ncbi:conserved hypothetical protein [Trichinella spiralis]|uniref:hypothetical protein n=1 Tax=Trichinella spiralis TaxID=6334 RepID=UPI0001EFEBFC|nr:conserved hypothetical protein [Trichinella spiralis]
MSYFIFIVVTLRICTCGWVAAKSANEDPTIKRCFPWRRPLTSLGPPEDAVVCACHRCAGCTRTKSTRTELLNLCQSQFGAIRRMYHELREKDAVLQNVEDPNMRAEL